MLVIILFIFIDYQIAGAQPGYKGNEFSNMILSLTPTVKISSDRVFKEITGQIVEIEPGFQAYDCFTGKIETVGYFDMLSNRSKYYVKVKVPVCATLADLPAKGSYNFDAC